MAVPVREQAECRLRERDAEIGAFRRLLDATCDGGGQLVLVEGEPGIGKSSLLACATRMAAERGILTVRSRGSELEGTYPYAVALDLLTPLVRAMGGPDRLDGPAAMARGLFVPDGGNPAIDPLAILHGLFWLLIDAAERSPLLMVIDDAHWADEPSLRWLHYVTQRAEGQPISIIAALRPGEPESQELGMLSAHDRATVLRPAGLTLAAAGEMVAHELGQVPDAVVDAWHSATRGNPFYLVELLREGRTGESDTASVPIAVDPKRVPHAVRRAILRRLARLGDEARSVAVAVAVLGDGCAVPSAASLAGLEAEDALRVAVRLAEAHVLDGGERLSFVHPIVRAAVESSIPEFELARRQRIAARQLAAENRPAEAIASHLLRAERIGDDWTVGRLVEAAHAATARGTPRAAVRYLARALAEPPAAYRRATILLELARAEASAGMANEAAAHFRELAESTPSGPERAGALAELGLALSRTASWAEAARAFQAGLDELGDASSPMAADLHAGFVSSSLMSAQPSEEVARRLSAILSGPIETPAERHLACSVAFQRSAFAMGDREEQLGLVRRAIEGATVRTLLGAGQTVELAAGVFLAADELDEDLALLDPAIAEAQRGGQLGRYCTFSYCRAWPNFYTGRLTEAVADGEAAVNGLPLGWQTFYPAACAVLAMALIETGDQARAEVVLALSPERWGGTLDFQFIVPIARGHLLLASGRPAEAVGAFFQADEVANRQNIRSPVILSWRAPLAIALAQSGERARAIAMAREEVAISDDWGAPRSRGVARHALGVTLGGEEGIGLLREAFDELGGSPSGLERTRVQTDLGAALRRAGHVSEAREALRAAMDAANRQGAVRLRDAARAELEAAGDRPRRAATTGPDALTPSERRVADLAASGRTNREIAHLLFVTPKAVEFHLANAYRKLQIGSRRELATALPIDEPAAARA